MEKIRARSGARAADGVLAAGAIRYGEPVTPTSITEITPAGPRYRNRSAVDLVNANAPFEATAELLWSGTWLEEPFTWRLETLPNGYLKLAGGIGKLFFGASIHELFSILILSLGMESGSPNERMRQGATLVVSARKLIQALTGCFGVLSKKRAYRPPRDGESIAEAVARALAVTPSREAVRALNAERRLDAFGRSRIEPRDVRGPNRRVKRSRSSFLHRRRDLHAFRRAHCPSLRSSGGHLRAGDHESAIAEENERPPSPHKR